MNAAFRFFRPILLAVLMLAGLSACFRPDTPLPPPEIDARELQTSIALGGWNEQLNDIGYHHQVYLDLTTGETTTVERTSWDLGFEASEDGFHVILNSANFMQAAHSGTTDFSQSWTEAEAKALTFRFDSATGNMAHTVLRDWWQAESGQASEEVYLIDRGRDLNLQPQGYFKLQLLSVSSSEYRFRYSQLDGSGEQQITIAKDPAYNFAFFSLKTNEGVSVEPPKTDWDLQFSYFSYRYPDGIPYWLTGVLTNRYQARSVELADSERAWEDLSLSDTLAFPFRAEIDEIGFDWKIYLFGPPARFIVDSERFYLVRDTEGYVYAIRFLDFYNEEGQKGFPLFTYRILTP